MELQKSLTQSMEETEDSGPNKKRRGGIRTMPFILAMEMSDKFATVGFHANMITFLTQQLNMSLVQASNTLTTFHGTASFTPVIGALIADSFAGQFWTITIGSFFYELGLIIITTSAILPKLHPPPCSTQANCQKATSLQLWVLYVALILVSIGTGGIRPCVVTFAANQFDMSKSGVEGRKWNYFNWYYFCMGLATLTALTVLVYIQDNVGWGWGLGIPTISMALSSVVFIIGYSLYFKSKPAGSPLVRLAQVIIAALRKRKAHVPKGSSLLYENQELDAAISTDGRLLHTKQFKWLDKAAIVTEVETRDQKAPNPWRLSTVHRVEELKSIIRILPIWAAGILYFTAVSIQTSFVIQEARTMERHLSPSFQIPPASLAVFSMVTMLVGLVLYERIFVPFIRRFTGNPSGITCLQRMGIGYVLNIMLTIVASLVEMKRKSVAIQYDLLDKPKAIVPVTVFWLVPQYCLHGLAEVFMNVGQLEFLYDQAPESMRSTSAALYYLQIALGNYTATFLVTIVHKLSEKQQDWLPARNINRGKLEDYFLLVSGIQVINFIYYVVCALLYTYKPLEHMKEGTREDEKFHADDTLVNDLTEVHKTGEPKCSTSNVDGVY